MRPAILAACLLAASCGDVPIVDQPCPASPVIAVESMTPPSGTALRADQTLTVDTTFTFTTCQQGRITGHARAEMGTSVPTVPEADGSIPSTELPAGRGTALLTATMTVPAGRRVLTFEGRFSWVGSGRGESWPVFSATYPIAD